MQVQGFLSGMEAMGNDDPVPRAWLGMIMVPPGGLSQQTVSTQCQPTTPWC